MRYRLLLLAAAVLVPGIACTDRILSPTRSAGAAHRDLGTDTTAVVVVVDTTTPVDTTTLSLADSNSAIVPDSIVTTDSATFPISSYTNLKPLLCPNGNTQMASGWIGPDGGTVGANGFVLTLPPNAVAQLTHFQVIVPASDTVKVEIHALDSLGAVIPSFQFIVPAKITMNLARCSKLPDFRLQAVYVDIFDRMVDIMQVGGADRVNKKLTFGTPHLSGYVIAY